MESGNQFPILDLLRRHKVPFVVIGGHAVIHHGFVRATEDVDIFDFIPGYSKTQVQELIDQSIQTEYARFVSLAWLRKMKAAAGRPQDQLDLVNSLGRTLLARKGVARVAPAIRGLIVNRMSIPHPETW